MQHAAIVLTTVVLGIIYLPTLRNDVRGVRYLFSRQYAVAQRVPVLSGMQIEPAEQVFYDSVRARFDDYFSYYPNKMYLNLSPDALYSTLDSHFAQIHPMYMYWDWTSQTLYPDFLTQVGVYVDKHRPLIISREVTNFANYCQINLAVKEYLPVEIYARPLIVLTPAEGVVTVRRRTGTTYEMTAQLDTVTVDEVIVLHPYNATQSARIAEDIPETRSQLVTVPWHANQTPIIFKFTTPLYGTCTYQVP